MSASPPLVTVAIPAFNHGRYVAEAIDSVLAQRHPRVELIVIDDGSTDDTASVLERYTGRARIVSQANAGQSAAINWAWEAARGEILSYLSADDKFEPHAIEHAVAALERHPDAVMVYGDYHLIDPDSRFVRHVRAPEFDYAAMVSRLVCAPGPGVFIRRDAASQLTGWDPSLRQMPDFDYWLRLSLLGPFARIPHVLAALRVHPGSTSFGVTPHERAEEPVRIMERYLAEGDLPAQVRALEPIALSSAHLVAARAHLRAGRLDAARRSLSRAWVYSPRNLLRPSTARLVANALVNRAGHRLLWSIRRLTRRG